MPRKTDVLEQKSPAEFFAENKNIAGFDNVGSLFQVPLGCGPQISSEQVLCCSQGRACTPLSGRLVENSLDAAESLGKLPQIDVTMYVGMEWPRQTEVHDGQLHAESAAFLQ